MRLKFLLFFSLFFSVSNSFSCYDVDPDYYADWASKQTKPPSPLINALRRGNVKLLQQLLLDDKEDVHGTDDKGELVCEHVAKNRSIPRQVSALSLLLQSGDHTSCRSHEYSPANKAWSKIKTLIVAAVPTNKFPNGVLIMVTQYMGNPQGIKRRKAKALNCSSYAESHSESAPQEDPE